MSYPARAGRGFGFGTAGFIVFAIILTGVGFLLMSNVVGGDPETSPTASTGSWISWVLAALSCLLSIASFFGAFGGRSRQIFY